MFIRPDNIHYATKEKVYIAPKLSRVEYFILQIIKPYILSPEL